MKKTVTIFLGCLLLTVGVFSGCTVLREKKISPLPGEKNFLVSMKDKGYVLSLGTTKKEPRDVKVYVTIKEKILPAEVPQILFDIGNYLLSDEVTQYIEESDAIFPGLPDSYVITHETKDYSFELLISEPDDNYKYPNELYRVVLNIREKQDRDARESIGLAFTETGVMNRDLDKPFSVEQITLF